MAIKLEHHFLNATDITKVQTTATVVIPQDSTYARVSDGAATTWDTGGWYSDNTAAIVAGDMLYFFGVQVSHSQAGVLGMMGVTYNAALSIGADAVMVYFVNGSIVGYNNGNFTTTPAYSAATLYDFRWTFTSGLVALDYKLSSSEDWTVWGSKAVDFTSQNCRAQADIYADSGHDYDLDRFVFTDSDGIPVASGGKGNGSKSLVQMGHAKYEKENGIFKPRHDKYALAA